MLKMKKLICILILRTLNKFLYKIQKKTLSNDWVRRFAFKFNFDLNLFFFLIDGKFLHKVDTQKKRFEMLSWNFDTICHF